MKLVTAAVLAVGVLAADTTTESSSTTRPVGTGPCYLPLDVYFLQDSTGSYIDDQPNIKKQLGLLFQSLEESNPDSFLGVGQFRDKPYPQLGEPNDYCYNPVYPLSRQPDAITAAASRLIHPSGGRDMPEAQLSAIISAAYDRRAGWRLVDPNRSSRYISGARLVIISTDATPHAPGDCKSYPEDCPPNMAPFPERLGDLSDADLCEHYDYPSDDDLKYHLDQRDAYLAILTPNDDSEVVNRWKEINAKLGNPADFHQFVKSDSSDLAEAAQRAIDAVSKYVCDMVAPPTTDAGEDNGSTEDEGPDFYPATIINNGGEIIYVPERDVKYDVFIDVANRPAVLKVYYEEQKSHSIPEIED